MSRILYLSHPEVEPEAKVLVAERTLSDQGRRRLRAAVSRGWPGRGWRIIAAPERSAQHSAQILSIAFGLPMHTHPDMGEVDHGAAMDAGLDAQINALFAKPGIGPEGRESANAASARIAKAFHEVLAEVADNLVFVGHGLIGSLLWCSLTKTPITHAQPPLRDGSFWAGSFGAAGFIPLHPWQALETAGAK